MYNSFVEDTKFIERDIEKQTSLNIRLERLKKIGCRCTGGCNIDTYTNQYSIKMERN